MRTRTVRTLAACSRVLAAGAILELVVLANAASQAPGTSGTSSVQCELAPPTDVGALEACLARAPQDVELWLELGSRHEMHGRLDAARAAYRRAVAVDPQDAEAKLALAGALLAGGAAQEALREARAAAALRPNDGRAATLLQTLAASTTASR